MFFELPQKSVDAKLEDFWFVQGRQKRFAPFGMTAFPLQKPIKVGRVKTGVVGNERLKGVVVQVARLDAGTPSMNIPAARLKSLGRCALASSCSATSIGPKSELKTRPASTSVTIFLIFSIISVLPSSWRLNIGRKTDRQNAHR